MGDAMKGKTVIVTGGAGGIGKEIARGLAKKGAKVVLAVRNAERGEAARAELSKDGDVSVMTLDAASQASIRKFAAGFKAKHDSLHVLVNNAGAWFTEAKQSPDGIELTWATNVLGPYLLTEELADILKKSAPARVVNIVSAFASDYDATDVEFKRRKYDGFKVYGASKQALRMITWFQAKSFDGTRVTANGAAPGFVKTDFNQNARGFMATMINLSSMLFAVSPAKGATTPIWVASAAELEKETAKFFDGMKEKDGKFRDEKALSELEKICRDMTSGKSSSRAA
jgi:NAD(P)-dependent dehydrogenase (short-subunit alcohol dehydrogenase family)